MQQVVLGVDRDLVCLDRAGTGIDDDLAFGAQLVPIRNTGIDRFFVTDQATGVQLSYGGYAPGTGRIYNQARIGAEFAADPFSTFTYTPPGTEKHLALFDGSLLMTYSGHVSGLSSWWVRHKIFTTSNGTSTGTVRAKPHNLFNFGSDFDVYLEP